MSPRKTYAQVVGVLYLPKRINWTKIAKNIHDSQTAKMNQRATPYEKARAAVGRPLTIQEKLAFRKAWDAVMGKPPLGSGKRFASLEKKLSKRGAYDPGALAAWIGRKTLGKANFQKLAVAGKARKRAAKK